MNILIVLSYCLFCVNLINCEPEPSYGIPNLLSRQQNNLQGLHQQQPQQQQQQQQPGYVQMYRSDSQYMNQMASSEPNHFNSAPTPNSYISQTTYSLQQQQSSYPPQQNNQQQTTFEIQPSYGYDLGSMEQQNKQQNQQQQQQQQQQQPQDNQQIPQEQQQPIGHDVYGLQGQEKSSNEQQELTADESFLHPQSTPYYPAQNNQYIPPTPPSAPALHQELPSPYQAPALFNSQSINHDYTKPSHNLNAPPAPSNPSVPSAPSTGSSSLYDDSYQPSGYDSTDGYYPPAKQTVHKHIYVHVPPKDFDEEAPRQHFKVPRAEKHYKIIFIKTPTPQQPQPVVPPVPQNEEKTLIYVLHKKPEEPEDITIPTPEPTQPSKPEVYFIKYKTQNNPPALYGAPTVPTEEEASAAAGNAYLNEEPRHANEQNSNINNNGIENSNNLYNSTVLNLHRYF